MAKKVIKGKTSTVISKLYIGPFIDESVSIHLTNTKGQHNKFYSVRLYFDHLVQQWAVKVRWGRIGTTGQFRNYGHFEGSTAAAAFAKKKIDSKIAKGYVEISSPLMKGIKKVVKEIKKEGEEKEGKKTKKSKIANNKINRFLNLFK